jgi:homoserine kinase type II
MEKEKLLAVINLKYGFIDVRILERVSKGYLSDNYILENQGKRFFLKKYRQFGKQRLLEIHAVKKFFSERGLPVVLPLEAGDGKTYFEWKNDLYSIFPYVEGKQCYQCFLSDQALADSGKMLARIHLQSKDGCPDIVTERTFGWNKEDFLEKLGIIRNLISKNKNDFDKKAEKFIQDKITLAENNLIKYSDLNLNSNHIIHGDYHQENIFFDENDLVKYVFDWEKTNKAPRVMEMARALEFSCFYGSFEKDNFRRAKVFLASYVDVYPVSKEELRNGLVAWYLSQVHSVWVLDEHYLKNNSRIDPLIDNYIMYLNYHSKNFKEYCNKVLDFI